MSEHVFRVEGSTAFTTPFAAGPWNPQLQHGGAPSSLIVWAAERIPTREPMQIVRLTVDLLRPVPIAPLEICTDVIREGKKIQLCSIRLLADGTEVVRGSVLKIRTAPDERADVASRDSLDVPGPDAGTSPIRPPDVTNAFVTGLSLRFVRGGFATPGPSAAWFRAHRPIVAGEPISPVMRAALTGDFCNGTSSLLDFRRWTFINGDLTVSLARPPVGEWILLDAQTWLGDCGTGLAFARLGDEQGYFGRAVQSLVVERRT
jgi:hypothetical protein